MILCTHGLTLRLFLMRWFHWTVAEYERIANPSNSQPIILERRSIEDIEHSMHTKECYVLSQESKEGLRGCSDDMCTMILPRNAGLELCSSDPTSITACCLLPMRRDRIPTNFRV